MSNPTELPDLDERAEFEAAQRKYHWPLAEADLRQDKIGNYYNHTTQANWSMWQTRAALARRAQPEGTVTNYGTTVDERAAFEAWARDHLGQGYPLTMDEDIYEHPVTRWAFKAWRAALASRPAEVDDEAVSILRTILTGDVGRQTLGKLARGQSTETEDGKAWLAAQRLVEQYRQGQRDAVAADRARREDKS